MANEEKNENLNLEEKEIENKQDNDVDSGESKKLSEEEIEEEVQKRFASQEEELRKRLRTEIENEKNLSDAQKFEIEKQKFAQEQEKWKKQKESEIISLNTEKVKSIYIKQGFPNDLVDKLVSDVGLDFAKEETKANEIISQINAYVDSLTKDLKKSLQDKQPYVKSGGSSSNKNESNYKKETKTLQDFFK